MRNDNYLVVLVMIFNRLNFIFSIVVLVFFFLIGESCTKMECPPSATTTTPTGPYTITLRKSAVSSVSVRSVYTTTNLEYTDNITVWATTQSGSNDIGRGYLKFDYSSIPSTATIIKATLMLYADSTQEIVGYQTGFSNASGPDNFVISPVTSSWIATTLTWNTQPSWDASITVPVAASTQLYENYSVDITSIAQTQFKDSASNYGIVMHLVTEGIYRGMVFNSANHADTATAAKLVVEYQ